MRAMFRPLVGVWVAAWLWPTASWADLSCDAVYSINTTSGVGTIRKLASPYSDSAPTTAVVSATALAGINGLGVNPKDLSKAYYFDTNSPPTSPATQKLYYVDLSVAPPTTGNSATPSFVIPSAAGETLAFGPDGTAYAYDYVKGELYRQGLSTLTFTALTGGAAPSTSITEYKVNDILVDAAGIVYAVGLYPKASPTSAHLVRFNPASAPAAEYVRALTLSPTPATFPSLSSGLAFAPGSTTATPLLLWTASGTGTYEIDVATGAATRATSASRADLASCPRDSVVRRIALTKSWAGAAGGEQVSLKLGGSLLSAVDGNSTAGGNNYVATALAVSSVSVNLSESFAAGSAADFTATASCTRNADGAPVTLTGNAFSMPGDSDVTCQFENRKRPRLTLVKAVSDAVGPTPAAPSTWTLTADGAAAGSVSGASGTAAVTNVPVSEGTYTLSESGGVAGYALTGWSCSGASLSGNAVNLGAGATATCTATNTRVTTSLRLAKQVAGDAPASPWNFTVTSSCLASPASVSIAPGGGVAQLDGLPTHATDGSACSYVLAEALVPGWAASAWNCANADITGTSVSLRAGAVAECSITNTRTVGSIRLNKKVDGGALIADWRFTIQSSCLASPLTLSTPGAGGSSTASGLPTHAADGSPCSYALAETAQPGWIAGGWSCSGGGLQRSAVTLQPNTETACEITNTRQRGTIRVTKEIVGAAAPAEPWSFTLDASSASCLAGPQTLTVPGDGGVISFSLLPTHALDGMACSYALAEAPVPGWQIDKTASSSLVGWVLTDPATPVDVKIVNRAIPLPQPVPALPAWPLVSVLLAAVAARRAAKCCAHARRQ